MKYWISTRERWPDLELSREKLNYYEGFIELTDKEWNEWLSVLGKFNAWQERFKKDHRYDDE